MALCLRRIAAIREPSLRSLRKLALDGAAADRGHSALRVDACQISMDVTAMPRYARSSACAVWRSSLMSEPTSFEDLIRRVRAGDQDAATELVRRYEDSIRRAVRFRLADTRLVRVLDSMDICQSVFASFFVRTAAGQFDI